MKIPESQPERIEWVLDRGQILDSIRTNEPDWVADELEYLWNNPEEFESGGTHKCPDGVHEETYILFRLGVAFGTDYEYYYPRDEEEHSD